MYIDVSTLKSRVLTMRSKANAQHFYHALLRVGRCRAATRAATEKEEGMCCIATRAATNETEGGL